MRSSSLGREDVKTEIFVILVSFNHVSFTLVAVVRVIHTLRNFLFKNQSKLCKGKICKLFWEYCFVFLSVVKLLYKKSLVVAIYNQIKSRNCQDLVKIYSFTTDILKSRLFVFWSFHTARKVYKTVTKGLQNSNLFVA